MRWGAAGQGGGATVQGWGAAVQGGEADTCKCRQIVDQGGREGEKKAEAKKEAKAKLLTQSSNTKLFIVQVKEKLESAKEAFKHVDWAEKT